MRKLLLSVMLLSLAASVRAEDVILMKHGNTVVTKSAFNAALEDWLPAHQRGAVLASEKKVRDLLAKMFVQYKLADEASERGLSEAENARHLHQLRRSLSSMQIEHLSSLVSFDNIQQQALGHYEKNKASYVAPEMVRVEHILISSTTRPKEQARETAEKVYALAKLEGSDFKKLVAEYSDDPSAKTNEGDLGYFGKGKMVKPFEEAAFGLQSKDELVGPVETGFGFHIIRLIDKKEAQIRPYDEVSNSIIAEIKSKARSEMLRAEYDRIGQLPNIEIDQDAIKSLVVNPFKKIKPEAASPGNAPAQ